VLQKGVSFPEVDTIYILTDGSQVVRPKEFTDEEFIKLARQAKGKNIRIFTVASGKDAKIRLLMNIAEITGGKFVQAEEVAGPAPAVGGDVDAVVESEAKRLGIELTFAKAIMQVESGGKWFSSDNRIIIRMEPHVFNSQSNTDVGSWRNKGKGKDGGEDKINDRKIAGVSCEGGSKGDYACFEKAKTINEVAAYNSISMGAGQIMGFNSKIAGYDSAQEMFTAFQSSAGNQAKSMFRLIESNPKLLAAVQGKDFAAFARIYNGDSTGRYAGKLKDAYAALGGKVEEKSAGGVLV
jgi:hypothetical protein